MKNPRLHVRFRVSSLRMRSQPSLHEMWRRTSNRAWHGLNHLNEALNGTPHVIAMSPKTEPSAADLKTMAELNRTLDAAETAVDFLNFVAAIEGGGQPVFEDREALYAAVRRNGQWIDPGEGPAATASLALRAAAEIALHLRAYVPREEEHEKDLLALDEDEGPAPAPTDRSFDVFISYRQRDYGDLAAQLSAALKQQGKTAWLDREQLTPPRSGRFARQELVRRLIDGILRSRVMVFFETYDEAVADQDYRGRSVRFNWQVLEQRYGTDVVLIRPKTQQVQTSFQSFARYRNMSDVAGMLVAGLDQGRRFSAFSRNLPDEVGYDQAAGDLSQQAVEYFGRNIAISPQAAVALLAPRSADPNMPILSDDVLVALLRQSAWAACMLAASGLDPESVLRVGAQVSTTRWEPPSSGRLPNVFGSSLHVDMSNDLLDEQNLLLGLLAAAAAERLQASELINRAYCLSLERISSRDEDQAAAQRIYDRLNETLKSRGRLTFPEQQWEIRRLGGRWKLRPCASCGIWRFNDPVAGNDFASIAVEQSRILYLPEEIAALEQHLNAGDTEALDRFFEDHPHFRRAFATSRATVVDILDLVPDYPQVGRITLHRLDEAGSISTHDGEPPIAWLLRTMGAATPGLDRPEVRLEPYGCFRPCASKALVVGAFPTPTDPGTPLPVTNLKELAVSTIPSLWRFLHARDLDATLLGA